jgi:uncharacterized membrane protein YkvA (DUF1232 family)
MNPSEQYLGYDGLNKLTVSDLRHGDKLLEMVSLKLLGLGPEQFASRRIEERVRFLMDLLRETFANRYQDLSVSAFAHILVTLDYFLKVKDSKPDTLPDGLNDDLDSVEELFAKFKLEFDAFRRWKVRQPAS